MPAPAAIAAFLLLGLLAPGFAGAQEGPAAEGAENSPWQMAGAEWTGALSAAAIDATVTARDERSWGILWQMVGSPAPGKLPEGRMAVAVFRAAGQGPSQQLEFSEVVAGETALVVGYRTVQADTGSVGGGSGDGVTAPYIVRLLPASGLPVYYIGTVQEQESE